MIEKVWVGKKVQVLSLEELKDKDGFFWYSENEYNKHGKDSVSRLRYENCVFPPMQKYCGKICEVSETGDHWFKLKEDVHGYSWSFWMVKEPVTIEDVLNSD